MRRREFVISACSVALVSRSFAQAGDHPKYTVGFLNGGSRPPDFAHSLYGAFARGMRKLGWTEGKDYIIEYRFADGNYERFPALAADLVRMKVDVILLGAMAATRPAQQATSTIPIVMGNSIDPVGNGLVSSLAHPGGNTTGLSSAYEDVFPKLVELIRLAVPSMTKLAFVYHTQNSIHARSLAALQQTISGSTIKILPVPVTTSEDIAPALDRAVTEGAEAALFPADGFFLLQRERLAKLAIDRKLPTIFTQREYAQAGALMSYGENIEDFLFRSATFVDKILKGAKPADLPVEQPVNFKLSINNRTAQKIGLTFPPDVEIRADEVIE